MNFKFGRVNRKECNVRPQHYITISNPLRSNRFIINTHGINLPDYLIRNYSLNLSDWRYTFELEFYDTEDYLFNPNEINNIESFTIIHLNSLGFVVHSVNLTIISFISFETSGNYTDDDLHINKINFLVRLD